MANRVLIGADFSKCELKYQPLIRESIIRMKRVLGAEDSFLHYLELELSESNWAVGERGEHRGKSAAQVYNLLFDKIQVDSVNNPDLRISLEIATYYSMSRVKGYGMAGTRTIYLNTKYLRAYKITSDTDLMFLGSNLLHEHSHDCGMEHDYHVTPTRPYSLSYILNRVYEKTYRTIYINNDVEVQAPVDKYYNLPWYRAVWPWNWN